MMPAKKLLLVIWAFVMAAVAWEIPVKWPRPFYTPSDRLGGHHYWLPLLPIEPQFVMLFVAVFIVITLIVAPIKTGLPEGHSEISKRQRKIAWTFIILASILMGFLGDNRYLGDVHGPFDCLTFYGLKIVSVYDIDNTGGATPWPWRLVDQLIMLKYLLLIMTAAICTHLIIAEEKKGTKTPSGTTAGPSADRPDAPLTYAQDRQP